MAAPRAATAAAGPGRRARDTETAGWWAPYRSEGHDNTGRPDPKPGAPEFQHGTMRHRGSGRVVRRRPSKPHRPVRFRRPAPVFGVNAQAMRHGCVAAASLTGRRKVNSSMPGSHPATPTFQTESPRRTPGAFVCLDWRGSAGELAGFPQMRIAALSVRAGGDVPCVAGIGRSARAGDGEVRQEAGVVNRPGDLAGRDSHDSQDSHQAAEHVGILGRFGVGIGAVQNMPCRRSIRAASSAADRMRNAPWCRLEPQRTHGSGALGMR